MDQGLDLLEAINHIDPAGCSYEEWLSVGMGLKEAGYPCSAWEEWSRGDPRRFHPGEHERKWRSFKGAGEPVTGGTIVKMAMDAGWRPSSGGYALDWDDVISEREDGVVVNRAWLERREFTEPDGDAWHPAGELIRYLSALFEPEEHVGYVTETFTAEGGRKCPTKGNYDRTAEQLITALSRCGDDIGAVLGDYDRQVGAWIRFNPLDGKGVNNDNVTSFRYALVESDSMDIAEQNAIIRELELPVACLVYSGGKSVHAIVRIDANSYEEYRRRVDFLYTVCEKNGMVIDKQNRNPSRLSRLPGAVRGDHKQFIIDTGIGKASWDEWREWIDSVSDDLPDPESMAEVWANMPKLAPCLIEGVLRQGHKLLLVGPSKAGKSFALIELCIAIAEGVPWLGFKCARGRVLYVNLELDRASCLNRFRDVYAALGLAPRNLDNLDIWNLRGKSLPMDKLAPKLIRRAAKKNYIAVVIDPIYKVLTGDENSADQMAKFCNQFDKVCTDLNCATIYCHHHSKGSQWGKVSMDRASGSGVFARDPDALLDLIELPVNEETKKRAAPGADEVRLTNLTALRIEGTLREFPKFAPVNLWFDYPVHRLDAGGELARVKSGRKQKETAAGEDGEGGIGDTLDMCFEALSFDGEAVTLDRAAEYWGITNRAARSRFQKAPDRYKINNGIVTEIGKN